MMISTELAEIFYTLYKVYDISVLEKNKILD